IGVGIEYCSSASARVIGSESPKSLNEVKTKSCVATARKIAHVSRGPGDTPPDLGCQCERGLKAGRNRCFWFVQAAARPAQRAGAVYMAGPRGLFKARFCLSLAAHYGDL